MKTNSVGESQRKKNCSFDIKSNQLTQRQKQYTQEGVYFFQKKYPNSSRKDKYYSSTKSTDIQTQFQSSDSKQQIFKAPTLLYTSSKELKGQLAIQSESLRRSIQTNLFQGRARVLKVGIHTIPQVQIPKSSAEYILQTNIQQKRLKNPQFFKSLVGNFLDKCQPFPQEVSEIKNFCKNKKILKSAAQKYFSQKQSQSLLSEGIRSGQLDINKIIENGIKDDMKLNKKVLVKEKIKEGLKGQLQEQKMAVNYLTIRKDFEQDTLFKIESQQYKRYQDRYLIENRFSQGERQFNKYNENYTSVQDSVFFKYIIKSRFVKQAQYRCNRYLSETLIERILIKRIQFIVNFQDESGALQEFYDNQNQEEIQYHNFRNNIKNPFLMDKDLLQIMKLSGILKKQFKCRPTKVKNFN